MSHMRPGNIAMIERWNDLNAFWKENKRGPYEIDFTEWCNRMGLNSRTAKEQYWGRGETLGNIRIVFEKRQKFWEYCDSPGHEETATEYMQRKSAEKKPKLSKKALDLFEKMEIRESMECNAGCKPLYPDKDCRECSAYTNKIAYEKQQREGEPHFLEEE